MASKLMHDGGSGGFRFDQNPVAKKPNYFKKLTQGHKPAPKKKASGSPYGSGNLGKLVKKYNPPKKNYGQPAQNTAKKNNPAPKKKSTGGAVGQGGKVYKNGYVDSKGNKVVNGRWVSPSKQSTGVTKKASTVKRTSSPTFKNPAKVAPKTVAAPVKPKLTAAQLAKQKADNEKKYLAGDTQYQNELGGLSDALSRYLEQNKADTGTLNRSYNSQVGKDGSIEKNRKKSQVGNSEGFAMRGMLRSGGYSDQATDINDTYKEQTGRVTDAFNDDKGRLTRASSAEKETVNQKREQARVAALSRKANQEILKAQASSQ